MIIYVILWLLYGLLGCYVFAKLSETVTGAGMFLLIVLAPLATTITFFIWIYAHLESITIEKDKDGRMYITKHAPDWGKWQ